jgi:hypothetical protein
LLSLPLVARYREQRQRVHTPGIHSPSLRRAGPVLHPPPFTLGPSHAQPLSFTLGPSNAHFPSPSFRNRSQALSLVTTHSHQAPNTHPPSPGSSNAHHSFTRLHCPPILTKNYKALCNLFLLMLAAWKTAFRPEATTHRKTALRPEDTGFGRSSRVRRGVL